MDMVLSHWSANAAVLAACAIVAATHLLGMRATPAGATRLAGTRPAGAGARAAWFYCGLFAVLVALVSPVAFWAGEYIWVRSVQEVLLALAAPSLIVLGDPWPVLRRGAAVLPRPARPRSGKPGRPAARRPGAGATPGGRSWRIAVAVTVAFNACWVGWHLPGGYDAAARHPSIYAAETVTYLGLGIAFWLQVAGPGPLASRLAPLRRLALVTGTFSCISVLSMALVFGSAVLYPAYRGPAHRVLGVVADQQLGGATIWAVALVPFGIAAVALCIRWLAADESEDLDAGLDRLLRRPASAWPSRPGFR